MRFRFLRKVLVVAACFAFVAALARTAQAFPTSGGGRASCTGCHGTQREAAIPSFLQLTARPGDLLPLTINLTNGADSYSASLAGLGAAGLAGFTPDSAWTNHVAPGTFNADPQYGGPFFSLSDGGVAYQGPVSHFFNLRLAANTQPGTYPLTFTVAGSGAEGLWRDSNAFSLTVVPEPTAFVLATAGIAVGAILWKRRRRRWYG
jgi:hypothetical protein